MAASPNPHGHDPATARPRAVAGRSVPARGQEIAPYVWNVFLTAAALFIVQTPTLAQSAPPKQLDLPTMTVEGKTIPRIGSQPHNPCVGADMAERKTGDTDCAAQKLQNATKAAQDRAGNQFVPNTLTATSPDINIGVANQAATKQRLGDNFGKSTVPQRPNAPPPTPSPFARSK